MIGLLRGILAEKSALRAAKNRAGIGSTQSITVAPGY